MFLRFKKGFTLVELVVVIAMMAIAASIAVPNLRGVTTRAEKDTYRSYCILAKDQMMTFFALLNSEDFSFTVTENYEVTTYNISTADGLTKAFNSVNTQSKFQYYVIGFTESNASTDPSKSIKNAGLDASKDVIVPVYVKNDSKGTYEIRGVWYYSMGKERVVLTFDRTNKDCDGYYSLKGTIK